ncbi:hypothetical protein [Actinobaculum sp. 313]|uniref:hypothetical protein n=1 Tax=Actinobaculum sp. 313 TaxID=2495645 RepID=UPI000D528284|nr:hypothetical protein [Actinobaculum sp. 313]AWE43148.1 hypothetical protein DDD63_10775 [Actinobaculum sp. 313]
MAPPDTANYTVSGVRIENGIRKATISGGRKTDGINKTLQVGESVSHPGVGTFTLLSITQKKMIAIQNSSALAVPPVSVSNPNPDSRSTPAS